MSSISNTVVVTEQYPVSIDLRRKVKTYGYGETSRTVVKVYILISVEESAIRRSSKSNRSSLRTSNAAITKKQKKHPKSDHPISKDKEEAEVEVAFTEGPARIVMSVDREDSIDDVVNDDAHLDGFRTARQSLRADGFETAPPFKG